MDAKKKSSSSCKARLFSCPQNVTPKKKASSKTHKIPSYSCHGIVSAVGGWTALFTAIDGDNYPPVLPVMTKSNPDFKLVHSFYRKAKTMNMLLKNNSRKRANIYPSKTVKHMLEPVIANKYAILSEDTINYEELYVDLE